MWRDLLGRLLLAVVLVTAAVTDAHPEGWNAPSVTFAATSPAQAVNPVPTQWRPQLTVLVLGDQYILTRGEGFKTEDECKQFLENDEFRGEMLQLMLAAFARDPDASMVGEPTCVARGAPTEGA